ncbi:hypothetical protein ScPMuIL_003972 [Solemya velum]
MESTVATSTVKGNATTPTILKCYDCSETSKNVFHPYTDCQLRPPNAPLRDCLSSDLYCMVERVTVKGMTVSIRRGCTQHCDYGCRYYGFGVSQYKCTSCCQKPGCNTGSASSQIGPVPFIQLLTLVSTGIFRLPLLLFQT